jgi:UDP-GlcNAc:undecaprenyl-phosphate GlcNAc-1-phosphate transferase
VLEVAGFRIMTWEAALAFLIAMLVVALVTTPLAMRLARRLGVLDEPGGRRIHEHPVPLLGGLGIVAGILVAVAPLIDLEERYVALFAGAILIALLGAVDDWLGLPPWLKLLGQVGCAVLPVAAGIRIEKITVPVLLGDGVDLGWLGYPLTVIFIVAVANIVNFADGMDGLAAGICAIAGVTFAILSISLYRYDAAIAFAAVGGACVGFLRWNFHPARVFMGDSGALPLGYLLAALSIQGVVKTSAALALVFPLLVLLVPILDTSFVILKRLKYGRPVSSADRNHFHHRLLQIGYSQRRAAVLLYAWCAVLACFAMAARFFRYRTQGEWHTAPTVGLSLFALVALAASVYVVYALEILKYRHLRMVGLARSAQVGDDVPLVVERRRRREEADVSAAAR